MLFHRSFDLSADAVLTALKAGNGYLLDVRTPEEYQEGHIPQAHLIPLQEVMDRMSEIPKQLPIYIYCRSGQRASTAKQKLLHAGYPEVYNIGGVMNWPYPLTK